MKRLEQVWVSDITYIRMINRGYLSLVTDALIGDLCEITFHMARHTFATSVTLTNGVPIESVSKMPGHKNIQATRHYVRVFNKKVSEDMQDLRIRYRSGNSIIQSIE